VLVPAVFCLYAVDGCYCRIFVHVVALALCLFCTYFIYIFVLCISPILLDDKYNCSVFVFGIISQRALEKWLICFHSLCWTATYLISNEPWLNYEHNALKTCSELFRYAMIRNVWASPDCHCMLRGMLFVLYTLTKQFVAVVIKMLIQCEHWAPTYVVTLTCLLFFTVF